MLIQNTKFANKSLATGFGLITFDAEGIAEVDDGFGASLIKLRGYINPSPAETTQEGTEEGKGNKEPVSLGNGVPDPVTLTRDELDNLTVPAIKKYAKERDIDVEGLTKKVELLDAIFGTEEN